MLENVGREDRLLRFAAGFIYLGLWFFGAARGTLAFALGFAAIYAAVTGAMGHDPVYRLLDFSTLAEDKREN
jgi:hypothetical protein